MNEWLAAAVALLILLAPCACVVLRGDPVDRLLGVQASNTVVTLAMLALAEGFKRSIYFDLALVYAFLSFAGTLVFIRFLERWE